MNLYSLTDDLRALGPSAVLRAGYEGSKRLGGHALLFGRLRMDRATPRFISSLPGAAGTLSRESLSRALTAAHRICEGHAAVFGEPIALPREPDWHATLDGDGRWPLIPWWQIDLRSEARIADVKWTWELARHRHLVILARAVHLDPTDEVTASFLADQLHSWLEQNPPEYGVHWYSNLEIALRALAWLQVLSLAGSALPPPLVGRMTGTLYYSARHLLLDLPYTLSSMRNNHLLGDALGLTALGKSFPTDSAARRWASIGDRIFLRQLRRHVRPDGSMVEDSIGYHRFVLEMLCARVLLGEAPFPVCEAMLSAAQFLARLGVGDGEVPQYGDWDEGRVLVATDNPNDLLGSVRLALALAGTGAPEDWRTGHDEVGWYAPPGEPMEPTPPECRGHDIGGGIARVRAGPFRAWLKAGSGPSHGHADLCSTAVAAEETWIVGDPGTGSYNGPIAQRNYFRSSSAHSVLRLEGVDQLEPHRAFRWRHEARGRIGPPVGVRSGVVLWGVHDAYCRLKVPRQVARVVVARDEGLTVADWVSGPPGETFDLALPLPPGASWTDNILTGSGGEHVGLKLPSPPRLFSGSTDPYDGWWSETYGQAVPATRLEIFGTIAGPVWWTVGSGDAPIPGPEGDWLAMGLLKVKVKWGPAHIRLVVTEDGREQVALIRTPR